LWCELVLNGIGGATIAEAQSTLSWEEFLVWGAYVAKRGSLNAGYRTEIAVGRLCAVFANFQRTKQTDPQWHVEDFAPHMDVERVITLEELAKQMGAV